MAETIYPQALTTVARIKDRLKITDTGLDTLFLRMINAATDMIEQACERRFLRQTYTQEKYSVLTQNMKYLQLRNFPVTTLTTIEYKAGTPSSPNYTALITDQFELMDDGSSGIVRIYDVLPYGVNALRVTYTAGYLIDFANFGTSTHTLPADLTELCERLVAKWNRRRLDQGKATEGFDGGSVTWSLDLEPEEKAILANYQRYPNFF